MLAGIEWLSQQTSLPRNVAAALLLIWSVLAIGSILRLVATRHSLPERRRDRLLSLRTWWILLFLVTAALCLGRMGVATLFAGFTVLGLREFLRLTMPLISTGERRAVLFLGISHFAVLVASSDPYMAFGSVLLGTMLIASRRAAMGEIPSFVKDIGTMCWGLVHLAVLPSFAVMLYVGNEPRNSAVDGPGWFVYLLVLTEANDIAQALWGRRFGRHRITPVVSPHKTWEGLLLGATTTVVLAVVLAPYLTPLAESGRLKEWNLLASGSGVAASIVAGLLVAMGGFLGDITMSTVKRECGVKDSGDLLPGQGGILDRIDSLTFTAPLLFYFVRVFVYDSR